MIFEFFNTLFKELCIKQPESPIDWMISRLHKRAPMRIVILGPPGGIKKEVCSLLSREMNIKHLSSGNTVLAEIEQQSEIGRQILAADFNDVDLVDDHLITKVVKDLIEKEDDYIDLDGPKTLNKGWVLDGFPRTFNQAQLMQVSG